ncbi:hypothetical protein JTB14_020875 [Gonioctena quinquepunctata]|nr:hypothetical protein JTB14_020875 [Gonioctena quinquepunctata]
MAVKIMIYLKALRDDVFDNKYTLEIVYRTMGQTLSEPVTAKDTSCCQNSVYKVGSSCMQGWRINMEDSHTHILSRYRAASINVYQATVIKSLESRICRQAFTQIHYQQKRI